MKYPTPDLLREMANDQTGDIPGNVREEMRELFLRAAEGLEQRGFFATPRLFLITEAKALEVELRGITNAAAKDDQVPGWRTFFEGKVHVNADGTDLVPVMAMESTQNQYASHEAAVIDAAHARARKPLTDEEYEKGLAQVSVKLTKRQRQEFRQTGSVTLTKEQKRQMQRTSPVFILPSYLGVATDRAGNVIGAPRS
jgi:hypothetical protein